MRVREGGKRRREEKEISQKRVKIEDFGMPQLDGLDDTYSDIEVDNEERGRRAVKPRAFECDICSNTFATKFSLSRHKKHVHGENAFSDPMAEVVNIAIHFIFRGKFDDSTSTKSKYYGERRSKEADSLIDADWKAFKNSSINVSDTLFTDLKNFS